MIIPIKIISTDDASLNISTMELNITYPDNSSIIVSPETTSENQTAYSKYIAMNYTYQFTSTSLAGEYTIFAEVYDEFGYSVESEDYTFEVIGSTTLSLTPNETSYPVSGISQILSNNQTIPFNITNTGNVIAYNTILTGSLSSNATGWIIYNTSLGNLSASFSGL